MIPIYCNKRNFWVVRADKGALFQKFTNEGFIGIGHLDEFGLENTTDLVQSKKISKNRVAQVRSFSQKIQENDWVVTLNNAYICIGRVLSEAPNPEADPNYKNRLLLRKKVAWGPKIERNHLPMDLRISLKTNLTVFNVNKCAESIYHAVFPYFIKSGTVHASLFINTTHGISSRNIGDLFNIIADIAAASSDEHLVLVSTVKSEFSSPGSIRVKYKDYEFEIPGAKYALKIIFAYTLLFGNSLTGFDGIIDVESRQKIVNHLIKWDDRAREIKSQLRISVPKSEESEILIKMDSKLTVDPYQELKELGLNQKATAPSRGSKPRPK